VVVEVEAKAFYGHEWIGGYDFAQTVLLAASFTELLHTNSKHRRRYFLSTLTIWFGIPIVESINMVKKRTYFCQLTSFFYFLIVSFLLICTKALVDSA